MEIKEYAGIGIIVTLLLSLGISVMPEDTHYCEDLQITMKCDRLSGTEKTCYPKSTTTKGKKYCSSIWQNILWVQEDEPIESTITEPVNKLYKKEQYECYPEPRGCELI